MKNPEDVQRRAPRFTPCLQAYYDSSPGPLGPTGPIADRVAAVTVPGGLCGPPSRARRRPGTARSPSQGFATARCGGGRSVAQPRGAGPPVRLDDHPDQQVRVLERAGAGRPSAAPGLEDEHSRWRRQSPSPAPASRCHGLNPYRLRMRAGPKACSTRAPPGPGRPGTCGCAGRSRSPPAAVLAWPRETARAGARPRTEAGREAVTKGGPLRPHSTARSRPPRRRTVHARAAIVLADLCFREEADQMRMVMR